MTTSKFTLQPAYGRFFIDRESLIEEMVAELGDPNSTFGFAIYGRRRVGKTSILREVARRLESNSKVVVVYISVWDLVESSLESFCKSLAEEMIKAYTPLLGIKFKVVEFLKIPWRILKEIKELKVVYDEIEFLIHLKEEDIDFNELVETVFNMGEKLARETKTKCVLMIDEFPSVVELKLNGSKVGEGIVRKIRSLFERWEKTALCISGSIRSTMKLVVLSSASPFYRQLIVREIKPLNEEDVMKYLRKNLNITERAAREVYRFSGGIPFYIQFLGRMLERKGGDVIDIEDVEEVEEGFIREEGNLIFLEEFSKLSDKERLVLKAMVSGRRTASGISKFLKDRVSNVGTFLRYLEDKGVVEKKEKGKYYIPDPVFEEWLARRLGGKSFTEEILDALEKPRSMEELYALFPERPESSVKSTVYRLVNRGLVRKAGKGKYCRK